MRKTSTSISTLIALAGAAAMSAPAALVEAVKPKALLPQRAAKQWSSYRRPGRAYPEQSTRQRLRNYRRAQGGPGLALLHTGKWLPRDLTYVDPKGHVVPHFMQDD